MFGTSVVALVVVAEVPLLPWPDTPVCHDADGGMAVDSAGFDGGAPAFP
jgi:hypothetical protein